MTLVERLRGDWPDREARLLAADRIEQLEQALREIIDYESGSNTHPAVRIARRALED